MMDDQPIPAPIREGVMMPTSPVALVNVATRALSIAIRAERVIHVADRAARRIDGLR